MLLLVEKTVKLIVDKVVSAFERSGDNNNSSNNTIHNYVDNNDDNNIEKMNLDTASLLVEIIQCLAIACATGDKDPIKKCPRVCEKVIQRRFFPTLTKKNSVVQPPAKRTATATVTVTTTTTTTIPSISFVSLVPTTPTDGDESNREDGDSENDGVGVKWLMKKLNRSSSSLSNASSVSSSSSSRPKSAVKRMESNKMGSKSERKLERKSENNKSENNKSENNKRENKKNNNSSNNNDDDDNEIEEQPVPKKKFKKKKPKKLHKKKQRQRSDSNSDLSHWLLLLATTKESPEGTFLSKKMRASLNSPADAIQWLKSSECLAAWHVGKMLERGVSRSYWDQHAEFSVMTKPSPQDLDPMIASILSFDIRISEWHQTFKRKRLLLLFCTDRAGQHARAGELDLALDYCNRGELLLSKPQQDSYGDIEVSLDELFTIQAEFFQVFAFCLLCKREPEAALFYLRRAADCLGLSTKDDMLLRISILINAGVCHLNLGISAASAADDILSECLRTLEDNEAEFHRQAEQAAALWEENAVDADDCLGNQRPSLLYKLSRSSSQYRYSLACVQHNISILRLLQSRLLDAGIANESARALLGVYNMQPSSFSKKGFSSCLDALIFEVTAYCKKRISGDNEHSHVDLSLSPSTKNSSKSIFASTSFSSTSKSSFNASFSASVRSPSPSSFLSSSSSSHLFSTPKASFSSYWPWNEEEEDQVAVENGLDYFGRYCILVTNLPPSDVLLPQTLIEICSHFGELRDFLLLASSAVLIYAFPDSAIDACNVLRGMNFHGYRLEARTDIEVMSTWVAQHLVRTNSVTGISGRDLETVMFNSYRKALGPLFSRAGNRGLFMRFVTKHIRKVMQDEKFNLDPSMYLRGWCVVHLQEGPRRCMCPALLNFRERSLEVLTSADIKIKPFRFPVSINQGVFAVPYNPSAILDRFCLGRGLEAPRYTIQKCDDHQLHLGDPYFEAITHVANPKAYRCKVSTTALRLRTFSDGYPHATEQIAKDAAALEALVALFNDMGFRAYMGTLQLRMQ